MVRADRLVEHRLQFVEQHGHVDRRDLELLAPRESQQLRGQLARPLGRGERAVGDPPRALVEVRSLEQEIERADDRGQQIVEIVRDPAGQLAERLELLRLLPAFGDPAALRHLAQREPDQRQRQQQRQQGGEPERAQEAPRRTVDALGVHRHMRGPSGQSPSARRRYNFRTLRASRRDRCPLGLPARDRFADDRSRPACRRALAWSQRARDEPPVAVDDRADRIVAAGSAAAAARTARPTAGRSAHSRRRGRARARSIAMHGQPRPLAHDPADPRSGGRDAVAVTAAAARPAAGAGRTTSSRRATRASSTLTQSGLSAAISRDAAIGAGDSRRPAAPGSSTARRARRRVRAITASDDDDDRPRLGQRARLDRAAFLARGKPRLEHGEQQQGDEDRRGNQPGGPDQVAHRRSSAFSR